MRKTSKLVLFSVLALFLFSLYGAQSVKEAGAQSVTTGANVETGVQGNGFSTQVARTVPAATAGAQAGTMKAGVPGGSVQGQEKMDTNPQDPKAPTGLRVMRVN